MTPPPPSPPPSFPATASPSPVSARTASAEGAGKGLQMARGEGLPAAFEASLEFFLSPLMPFFRDADVSEIIVNGHERVYVEKGGKMTLTKAHFASEADVQAAARNIAQFVGQSLSTERPLLDGRLPDGSRVTIVLSPIAAGGTQINIRRFAQAAVTPEFLLERGALSEMALEFLLLAVKAHRNIVVSGGAGSGKTTLVNVLTNAFAEDERVIVIEETRELQVQKPHVVQLESRPADAYGRGQITVRDLFITALRMRPDRIVVGEVRRGEALDMIQAMTSGHHGSLTTLHASTPTDTCHRLETMALMADVGIPLFALRRQIASAMDLVVHVERLGSGRRLVRQISEVTFDEKSENYVVTDIFRAEGGGEASLAWTGAVPETLQQMVFEGLSEQMKLTRPILEAARKGSV